jgi:hypothetical protein
MNNEPNFERVLIEKVRNQMSVEACNLRVNLNKVIYYCALRCICLEKHNDFDIHQFGRMQHHHWRR